MAKLSRLNKEPKASEEASHATQQKAGPPPPKPEKKSLAQAEPKKTEGKADSKDGSFTIKMDLDEIQIPELEDEKPAEKPHESEAAMVALVQESKNPYIVNSDEDLELWDLVHVWFI